jgi:hypothetical protein
VRKNGCSLLRFDFIYGDLVRWLEGEYTNCDVYQDTMFNNMDDLRTTDMPQGYPKVNLDQTRETLKNGAPTKGTFTSNFRHARQLAQYNNHNGMHDHIDIMTDKFAKEEDNSYHLCFPRYFLYFVPSIVIALLSLIMQKQKFRIIIYPNNTIFEGDTGNVNAQMPKPWVDHQRNPAVYYVKYLLRHWVYICCLRQRHTLVQR